MGQNKCLDVVKEKTLTFQMEFLKGWGADTPAHPWHPPKALKLGPSLVQAPCIADAKRWAVSKQDLSHQNTAWRCLSYLQGLKQLDTSVRLRESPLDSDLTWLINPQGNLQWTSGELKVSHGWSSQENPFLIYLFSMQSFQMESAPSTTWRKKGTTRSKVLCNQV